MANHTRTCTVDGCDRKHKGHGLCSMHWQRARNGNPVGSAEPKRKSYDADEKCHAKGCENDRQGGAWCGPHWQYIYRHGEPRPLKYKWAEVGDCEFCGERVGAWRSRRFCSARCQGAYLRHGGRRPEVGRCMRCGGQFDLMTTSRNGRLKRTDTKMCPDCKRGRGNRHGYSVKAIVAIHGRTDCGICGEPVDLELKSPHKMRASIDHIRPYAHGGSHDPSNLQLAHLHCNHVKSDRITP